METTNDDLALAVRAFIIEHCADQFQATGRSVEALPDNFDLLGEGILDSLGIVQLISAIEERFNLQVDMEQLPPEELTVLGSLSRYIARQGK